MLGMVMREAYAEIDRHNTTMASNGDYIFNLELHPVTHMHSNHASTIRLQL